MFRFQNKSSTSFHSKISTALGKSNADVEMEDCTDLQASGLRKRPLSLGSCRSNASSSNKTDHSIDIGECTVTVEMKRSRQKMLGLVQRGKWDVLIKELKKKSNEKISREVRDASGLSLLGVALASDAPANVVEAILNVVPESTGIVDVYGATPLHLACLNGTTYEIVSLILSHDNGSSARILDHENYTALHHAVEYACMMIKSRYINETDYGSYEDMSSLESIEEELDEYKKIVEILCQKVPEQVHVLNKDNDDAPLDIPNVVLYKIGNNLPVKGRERMRDMHRILKTTSIAEYQRKKKQWERNGFRATDCKTSSSTSFESEPSLASSHTSNSNKSKLTGTTSKQTTWIAIDEQLSLATMDENVTMT